MNTDPFTEDLRTLYGDMSAGYQLRGGTVKDTYKIIRYFQDLETPSQLIINGLTLEQAQRHCQSEETSSSTATSPEALEITRQYGEWFEGYEKED